MSQEFKELDSLSELDFHDESHEPEEEEEFHAPVEHTQGTSLDSIDQDSMDDFNYVRKVYLSLIENGQISLEVAIKELRASGHPRAAEVVGGMIKQIADVSGQLLDVNEKMRGGGDKKDPGHQTNIQNNHYYGSTSDFLDRIEEAEAAQAEEAEIVENEEAENQSDSESDSKSS